MEKIIQHSWKEELNKWSLTFKQKVIEQNYQQEEKKKRSRIHMGFAYVLICWAILLIFYQAAIKREFRYLKFYIYYINHFFCSTAYLLINRYRPQFYNISHFIYVYAYTLNVTWGIYDKDFLEFDDRKSISYGYINAFLLCSCIEGGTFIMKSFLFTTTGFMFVGSESLFQSQMQTTNFIRLLFPSILYILKLRHEEIAKRQIFISTNQVVEWASMIHKQLPTPFMIGKYNKKEERLEYYSSNLKAEKQLKIIDNNSFNSFLENCFINDTTVFMNRKNRTSFQSGMVSSLEKNSSFDNSFSKSNLRNEQNSLKWLIRENLHDLQEQTKFKNNSQGSPSNIQTNNQKMRFNATDSYIKESVSVQNKRSQSPNLAANSIIKQNTEVGKNNRTNIFMQNSKVEVQQNNHMNNLSDQHASIQPMIGQFKNEGIEQRHFYQQNQQIYKEEPIPNIIGSTICQKNDTELNIPLNKSLPVGSVPLIQSPQVKDAFIEDQFQNQGIQEIDQVYDQIKIVKQQQIKQLKLNTQLVLNFESVQDQDNLITLHSQRPVSKKCLDTETPMESKNIKYNTVQNQTIFQRTKSHKLTKEQSFEAREENLQSQNQGQSDQKNNFSKKLLQNKGTQEKINGQSILLNEKDQKQKNLFNLNVDNDQEEAISVIHFYKKDGNETEKKYTLRQKYFQSNELYIVIILENESFKSKYEKEKRKNYLVNAITTEQEDYVKESIYRIDKCIKEQFPFLNKELKLYKDQLTEIESFKFVLTTCANLFIMHETYKIFNSFLKKQRIEVVSIKFDIFSTAQIIVNSLNLIYKNQNKSISVKMSSQPEFKQELFVQSDPVKIKVLLYNLFNYLLDSSHPNSHILVALSSVEDTQISQMKLNNINISIQFSKNMNEKFLKDQNLFSLNYTNLFNDSQNIQCQYKPLWQLRTACRIITLLGPYSKLYFLQEDNYFIFSFLLYENISIIQAQMKKKPTNNKSRVKNREFSFMEYPNINVQQNYQVNNLQKLSNYNNESKFKFVRHILDLNQIKNEYFEEQSEDNFQKQEQQSSQTIKTSNNCLQSQLSLKSLINQHNQKQ